MTLADLLNSDMTTIGRALRAGFDWWCEELVGLLPRALTGGGRDAAACHRIDRDGRVIPAPRRDADTVLIPADLCLTAHVAMPRMGLRDAESAARLDADRLLPLEPDAIVIGVRARPDAAQDTMLAVTLCALPLARAQAIATALEQAGIVPRAIGPLDPATGRLACDLAPGFREHGLLPQRPPVAQVWWAAAGIMLLLNIATAIVRDSNDVAQVQALVDGQEPALLAVRRIEGRLRDNAATITRIAARREHQQPLRTLAALGTALPQHSWVEHWEWDGTQVRVSGFAAPDSDPVATVRRAGPFSAVRAGRAEAMADTVTGKPFDFSARLEPRR